MDVSDLVAPTLWGSGRHTRDLVGALHRHPPGGGLEMRFLAGRRRGPELAWEQVALPHALRRHDAAVVHSPNCFLPLRRPCPGVVTVHDLAFEAFPDDFSRRTGLKYRAITPRAARSAERVICVSRFTADDVCRRYGIDPARVRVVHPAPSLPVTGAPPPPGPYVLAVGDLRPKKNLLRLVEAFRTVHAGGAPHRLVLAGRDAGQGERLRALAGGAPVELTGYVGDERLDALMRGAELLVHPCLYEGFGLAVAEAMARGVPVAAARAAAMPETCGGAAAYFDPLDPADMAAVIGRLLDDSPLRDRMARDGRERARAFSWAATAERTVAVYRELLP